MRAAETLQPPQRSCSLLFPSLLPTLAHLHFKMPVAPPPPDASAASLPLIVLHQQAYLYAPQHIALARSAHHLTPMLTGTLPLLSQQNVFLGPPALLLPEEVVLLLRRGECGPRRAMKRDEC